MSGISTMYVSFVTTEPQVQPENSVLQWGDLNLLLLSRSIVTVYYRQDGTWVVKTDSGTM